MMNMKTMQALNHLRYGNRGDYVYFDESKVKFVRLSTGENSFPDIRMYRETTRTWKDLEWPDACEEIDRIVYRECAY